MGGGNGEAQPRGEELQGSPAVEAQTTLAEHFSVAWDSPQSLLAPAGLPSHLLRESATRKDQVVPGGLVKKPRFTTSIRSPKCLSPGPTCAFESSPRRWPWAGTSQATWWLCAATWSPEAMTWGREGSGTRLASGGPPGWTMTSSNSSVSSSEPSSERGATGCMTTFLHSNRIDDRPRPGHGQELATGNS